MKRSLSAALLLSLALALPGLAADKKPKKPTGTPSTLPPTSPNLVVTPPDATAADGSQPGKLISSEMSGRDLEFFTKAVEAGRQQAFFVDLLKKSASSEQIKKLADALTTAQNEENMHIAKLAGQKGWSVSLEPTTEDKKAGEEIEKLSGSNFDKAAMDKVAAASSQAQAAYEGAAQSTDPQIKTFAAQMLPLAEEKRHLVEKMTGAGAKTANQLFRHGGTSEGVPAATPSATPAATPVRKGKGKAGKVTPPPADPAAPPLPAATPASAAASTPAGKLLATPTPLPSALGLPIATPPGLSAPATILPPIVPPKAPPAPVAK
ncbi:MAG: DUF4142 domain-containing protein [Chthoniobacter sp.]|nr:DUF4142 domain-containing protein [Chthoniobacter sp.]